MTHSHWRIARMLPLRSPHFVPIVVAAALFCHGAAAQGVGGTGAMPMAPPEILSSPYSITIDPIFHWASTGSGQPVDTLPSSDCRRFDAGLAEINAAYPQTAHLTSFQAGGFLEKAYKGQDLTGFESYVTDVVLGYQDDGSADVHVGSQLMNLLCGFERKQTISAQWANAGVSDQYVYAPARPLTLDEQFRGALFGKDYNLTVQSLTLRGLYPGDSTQSVTERCGIGLEAICQRYANAHCANNEWGTAVCEFDWAAPEDELVVSTQVTSSAGYFWLSVIDVKPLPHPDDF